MGRRGVHPKPTALRLLEGDRTDRINLYEPAPRQDKPECPDDVSPEVREIWDYTVRELEIMGTLFACDRDALRCYCEAVVTHRRACAILAKSGVVMKGIHGNPVRNPALPVQRDSAATIRSFAGEFGLTPSSRSQITTKGLNGDGAADNPFAGTG